MRMWMVEPKLLCRKHLLGQHVELHMLNSCVNKNKSIQGFINGGIVEIHNIHKYHDSVAAEMLNRGYNHQSMIDKSVKLHKAGEVSKYLSLIELQHRCPDCKQRIKEEWRRARS